MLKNSHNFTCGQYFFMKPAPLCSADTELLIHTKNSLYEKSPMVPFLIAGHIYYAMDMTSAGFFPGQFKGLVGGHGLDGVCDHIKQFWYHIKE